MVLTFRINPLTEVGANVVSVVSPGTARSSSRMTQGRHQKRPLQAPNMRPPVPETPPGSGP